MSFLNFLRDSFAWIYMTGLVFIISYLIGSIPTGYIIVKTKTGQDIRETGSGSTGATNVKRILGTKYFFIVMILDAIKGVLPVILALKFATFKSEIGLSAVIAAIAVIIGHSKSLFLNFKGGKSVATGVGTLIALNWQVGLIVAAIWGVLTYFTNYVSVGSIVAVICAPILMIKFNQPVAYVLYCVAIAAYIIYLHRENIQRLINGNENKVRK
ncbi:glycerol-3-phosphate 1-O-acyltransferase PlsY [bacterium]|nr:glycerol-3-phosphate 1-O-acyltransferase PlsY [bacterium]